MDPYGLEDLQNRMREADLRSKASSNYKPTKPPSQHVHHGHPHHVHKNIPNDKGSSPELASHQSDSRDHSDLPYHHIPPLHQNKVWNSSPSVIPASSQAPQDKSFPIQSQNISSNNRNQIKVPLPSIFQSNAPTEPSSSVQNVIVGQNPSSFSNPFYALSQAFNANPSRIAPQPVQPVNIQSTVSNNPDYNESTQALKNPQQQNQNPFPLPHHQHPHHQYPHHLHPRKPVYADRTPSSTSIPISDSSDSSNWTFDPMSIPISPSDADKFIVCIGSEDLSLETLRPFLMKIGVSLSDALASDPSIWKRRSLALAFKQQADAARCFLKIHQKVPPGAKCPLQCYFRKPQYTPQVQAVNNPFRPQQQPVQQQQQQQQQQPVFNPFNLPPKQPVRLHSSNDVAPVQSHPSVQPHPSRNAWRNDSVPPKQPVHLHSSNNPTVQSHPSVQPNPSNAWRNLSAPPQQPVHLHSSHNPAPLKQPVVLNLPPQNPNHQVRMSHPLYQQLPPPSHQDLDDFPYLDDEDDYEDFDLDTYEDEYDSFSRYRSPRQSEPPGRPFQPPAPPQPNHHENVYIDEPLPEFLLKESADDHHANSRYYSVDLVLKKEESECSICYEEFQIGQSRSRLICLCIFHKHCIDGWFNRQKGPCCPSHKTVYEDAKKEGLLDFE